MPPIHEQLNGKTALRVGFSVAMYDYQMVYTSHGCPSSFITHSARDAYPIWLVVSTHPMLVGNGKKKNIYIYIYITYVNTNNMRIYDNNYHHHNHFN